MIVTPVALDVPLWTDKNGKIRIGESQVLLELVIHAFQRDETPQEIVESYDSLKLAEVFAVLAYYLANRDEVDAYVQQADASAERLEQETRANYSQETRALVERLSAARDSVTR